MNIIKLISNFRKKLKAQSVDSKIKKLLLEGYKPLEIIQVMFPERCFQDKKIRNSLELHIEYLKSELKFKI